VQQTFNVDVIIKIRIYETIILPVVLYGCETWSLSLREEHRLRDLREIGWGDIDWIHLAQDSDQWRTLVNTVMNLRIP
jgi:hypothetical protein